MMQAIEDKPKPKQKKPTIHLKFKETFGEAMEAIETSKQEVKSKRQVELGWKLARRV